MLWDGPLVYSEDQFKEYIGQLSNPCQSMPILNNSVPIPGQFVTNCRTDEIYNDNLSPTYQIGLALHWQCIGSNWQKLCQSQAIYEAICLDNQGTSALYGMVPSLLGG